MTLSLAIDCQLCQRLRSAAYKWSRENLQLTECPDCGASLDDTPVIRQTPPKLPRRIRPAPHDIDERAIREYVGQALEMNRQEAKSEKRAHMDSSTIIPALSAAQLGVIGNGCTGTKRGWRPVDSDLDPRDCHVDPELAARYAALRGEAKRITDAVIDDQAGFQDLDMKFGTKTHRLTIFQRVALRMADEKQAEKWHAKFASGDSAPALAAAEKAGPVLLLAGAKGWWGK